MAPLWNSLRNPTKVDGVFRPVRSHHDCITVWTVLYSWLSTLLDIASRISTNSTNSTNNNSHKLDLNHPTLKSKILTIIMTLESCMILLDNSEYMRNGDYVPNRLDAQKDAANLLVGAKTQSNPETTIGIAAGTEVLCSPTAEVSHILNAIHRLQYHRGGGGGGATTTSTSTAAASNTPHSLTASVQVASLALKHRRNKLGGQRIVLFVGTPLPSTLDGRALQKAGRQLKKNNIALDVVALGEIEDNESKLRELVDAANGGNSGERTCHLVTVPAEGGALVSDVLAGSPVLGAGAFAASAAMAAMGAAAGVGAVAGGGVGGPGLDFADFGGVDPNLDPELAMALRVSMEEERHRQERLAAAEAEAQAAAASSAATSEDQDHPMNDADAWAAAAAIEAAGLSEEEALLQRALAMSMNESEPAVPDDSSKPTAGATATGGGDEDVEMQDDDDEDEDAAMQVALQMSLQGSGPETSGTSTTEFQDPSFVSDLLAGMPGVDPNDPELQRALRQAREGQDDKDGTEKKKKPDDQANP